MRTFVRSSVLLVMRTLLDLVLIVLSGVLGSIHNLIAASLLVILVPTKDGLLDLGGLVLGAVKDVLGLVALLVHVVVGVGVHVG